MTPRGRTVRLLGVPLDLGQSERGTDVGPAALRYAGLASGLQRLGHEVFDSGNLDIPVSSVVPKSRLVEVIANTARRLADHTAATVARGEVALTLGGDHSVAMGSVSGATRAQPTGLLWIDAHGDFNTPEISPSGNVHGMPLAVLLGSGHSELVEAARAPRLSVDDVALVGIRQLDGLERERLRDAGIHVFSMRDIDERGMARVASEALDRISGHGRLHVSFDVDALDPSVAPGVATPVPGGLSYREAHLLMEMVSDTGMLASMDIVEVNPMLDVRNATARVAVELALSALGNRIY